MDFIWIVKKDGFQNLFKVIEKLTFRCSKLVVNKWLSWELATKLGVNMEIDIELTRKNLTNTNAIGLKLFFTSSKVESTVVGLPLQ